MSLIQLRRGSAAQWAAANPVLAIGEPGFVTDTQQLKVGDGVTAWGALPVALNHEYVPQPTSGTAAGYVPTVQGDGTVAYAPAVGGSGVIVTDGGDGSLVLTGTGVTDGGDGSIVLG